MPISHDETTLRLGSDKPRLRGQLVGLLKYPQITADKKFTSIGDSHYSRAAMPLLLPVADGPASSLRLIIIYSFSRDPFHFHDDATRTTSWQP
jgi:hypothetical protein